MCEQTDPTKPMDENKDKNPTNTFFIKRVKPKLKPKPREKEKARILIQNPVVKNKILPKFCTGLNITDTHESVTLHRRTSAEVSAQPKLAMEMNAVHFPLGNKEGKQFYAKSNWRLPLKGLLLTMDFDEDEKEN